MSTEPTSDLERLIGVEEVAELLGLTRQRVYTLARQGVLPHVRLGRTVRSRRSSLLRWIEREEVRP